MIRPPTPKQKVYLIWVLLALVLAAVICINVIYYRNEQATHNLHQTITTGQSPGHILYTLNTTGIPHKVAANRQIYITISLPIGINNNYVTTIRFDEQQKVRDIETFDTGWNWF